MMSELNKEKEELNSLKKKSLFQQKEYLDSCEKYVQKSFGVDRFSNYLFNLNEAEPTKQKNKFFGWSFMKSLKRTNKERR